MTTRLSILTLAFALGMSGLSLRADDAKDAKPAPPVPKADAPKADAPKPDAKDEKRDEKRPPRPDRGPGDRGPGGQGGPGQGPGPEWGPPRGEWTRGRVLDQFSADELREMIKAVEGTTNKRLADKMKQRFEEAIARKPSTLTQEQLDAALDIFKDREPYLHGRLKESLEKDPTKVNAMLAMQWPRLEQTIDLKKTDRELYDAQTQEILRQGESRGIEWKLHQAIQKKDAAETQKLKDELKTVLLKQHEARQHIRKLEKKRLDEKMAKLSEEITKEESKSADAIEKNFNFIVKWAETGRWPGDRGDRGGPGRGDRDKDRGDKERGEKGEKPEKRD